MQAKCRMKLFVSWRRSTVWCNGGVRRSLDRVIPEPAPREVTRRSRPSATPRDDACSPLALRLEIGKRRLESRRGDGLPLQVEADRGVAETATGQGRRPGAGEALVVDEPRSTQRVHRLFASRPSDAGAPQPLAQALLREVAPCERAPGDAERAGPPQLPRERA